MSVPTFPCPNCKMSWPLGAGVCPHCGYLRSSIPAWPPPPTSIVPLPAPPGPKLVTGAAWGDLTLGIGLSFASNFLYCLGFLVMPILYFTLKPNYPVFARGIGHGTLAGLVLLLGALLWCVVGVGSFHG